MNEPTLVASFSADAQAYLAKGMLEDAGIASYVVSNNMATLYGAGATWAPIELYVAASDAPRAVALLREHGDI